MCVQAAEPLCPNNFSDYVPAVIISEFFIYFAKILFSGLWATDVLQPSLGRLRSEGRVGAYFLKLTL